MKPFPFFLASANLPSEPSEASKMVNRAYPDILLLISIMREDASTIVIYILFENIKTEGDIYVHPADIEACP